MIPATLCCSAAFLLPIGTPGNALVFSSGFVKTKDMVTYGLLVNLIAAPLISVWTFMLLSPVYHVTLSEVPDWAEPTAV